MTSIKVKLITAHTDRTSSKVFYQVYHERKITLIDSGFRLQPEEWDSPVDKLCPDRRHVVSGVRRCIHRDLEQLAAIVRRLDNEIFVYTSEMVCEEFRKYKRDYELRRYMQSLIDSFRNLGRLRTAETYTAALNSFHKFLSEEGYRLLPVTAIGDISQETTEAYQAWLSNKGIVPNTISFYMRILRAAYNKAVHEGAIEQSFPFRKVYTGVEKTVKRALPLSTIRIIKNADLASAPGLDYARDMFMLSFYLRGMSFIDMAYLRKQDLRFGHVEYRRRKTGQLLTIAWTADMQAIVDKYSAGHGPYLLPILSAEVGDKARYTYKNRAYKINSGLKKLSNKLGIGVPVTLYCARHSWASAAKCKGIPLSVISQGMGHDSEATTRIYLASLDNTIIDNANALIMSSI